MTTGRGVTPPTARAVLSARSAGVLVPMRTSRWGAITLARCVARLLRSFPAPVMLCRANAAVTQTWFAAGVAGLGLVTNTATAPFQISFVSQSTDQFFKLKA